MLVFWLGLLGAATAGSHALGGVYADNFTLSSTSAQQGANLLHAHRPTAGGQGGQLVFNVRSGSLAAHQDAIEVTMTRIRALPDVLAASDPLAPGAIAPSGQTAYATVHFSVNPQSLGPGYLARVNQAVGPARPAAVSVNYGGQLGQAGEPKSKDPRRRRSGSSSRSSCCCSASAASSAPAAAVTADRGRRAALACWAWLAAAITSPRCRRPWRP